MNEVTDMTAEVPYSRHTLSPIEAAARAAEQHGGEWEHDGDGEVTGDGLVSHPVWIAHAAHIARHDPAHVLATVAALRRVVELHYSLTSDAICGTCGELGDVEWPCPTLRALAAIYADRPGFRTEWSA